MSATVYRRAVIDDYLGGEDWDEPPPDMAIEEAFGDILDESVELSRAVSIERPNESAKSAPEANARAKSALGLYLRIPALVNVALNYKICAEHGLPLHPTVYYELAEARRYDMQHPIAKLDGANRLYLASIELARSAYRLEPDYAERAAAFKAKLPEELPRFVYTGIADRYSWRGAEPATLAKLARKVKADYEPSLIIAAAHGAIMPALLLAEYLELPLYFIRFSMFKRKDEAPIISVSDEVWLSSWREKPVLLYDEDVAGGTTLELFTRSLRPFFAEARSACSIRHAGARFNPDYVGKYWCE
jgi:hypothetical protein